MICIGKYQAHIGIKYVYEAILEKFGVAGFLRCILISNILRVMLYEHPKVDNFWDNLLFSLAIKIKK
jgi:predicted NAD-dependent protein-ADP-ribosyltransferase YbiA (DUF1768 family)